MSIQPDPLGEELKHYQSDLSGLASLIEALLNNTGAGIYIVQDKNFVYVNPFFEQLSGYTMQELAGIPSLNLVHPDDRDMIRKKVTKILKEKSKANTYEYRFIKKNGEVVWVLERITSMEYMGQRAAMCSFMDINQRKVLEDALAKSEERYRSVLEQMPDMYYEVDLKGNYTYVNDAFCKFGGRSSEELMNVNFRLLGDPALHDFIYEKFNEVFRTGQPNKGFSYRTVTKDGTVKHVETSVRLLKNEKGKATGFSCFSRDITERTRLEEELQRSEEKYRTMLEQMQDGYYEVDLKGNYTFANTAAGNILGVPKEQLIGTNYRVLTPPDEVGRVFQAYNQVFKSGIPNTGFAHKITIKAGQSILCESSVDVRKNERGEVIGFRSVVRDVTERKMLEAELRLSEEKYRSILKEMEDAYYEVDLSGNFQFVNEATARHTGYSAEELIKMNFRQVTYEEDINPVFTAYNNVYRSGEANKGYAHRMVRKDGTIGYVEAAVSVLKDKQGAIVGFRCVSRDVTERKLLEQKLADMATHDFLTGLPNRILLNDRFQVALAQANRNNYKLGIMSLDLDHFKEVNDSMGHAVGDQLLKATGIRLSNILRSSDTVARLGGDEFLLLLQEIHYPEDAILIAEKIIDSCKEPLRITGFELHISTSIGICIYPDDGEDMDTLMRKSDAAMYFSKRHGGMQHKVFTTSDQLDISQS
jgi:diguanylate cyclase (GGDEF)-like protein/PAS domain S-box-containing protein